MKQINENMHGSIGSIGSFDRPYMVEHARKWLIVRETAKTAKTANTAMRIFVVEYRICLERKKGRRWANAWKERSMGGGIPPETEHRLRILAGTAASTKRLHKYSLLEAANIGHQSYSLMKSRAQDTAPALEAPDTEHIGGSKSRAGIKFRRNERSMDGGIPPETGHRSAETIRLSIKNQGKDCSLP